MARILAFLYGLAAYVFFFGTFGYLVGFVGGWVVPKTIDTGIMSPAVQAVFVNLTLLTLFGLQHSVMARKSFKQRLTRIVSPALERSTYVLMATLVVAFLIWKWRPMPSIVWQVKEPAIVLLLTGLALAGWAIALVSTFLISHFELFGLRQVAANLTGRKLPEARFRTPALYKFVRHPLYLGFLLAFWSAPVMTAGHLLFAAGMTVYILIGIAFEERDLIRQFGEEYQRYRKQVAMLFPVRWGA
jgi:protein-S-isoprenylcysteine O-methyltransferase Ste14